MAALIIILGIVGIGMACLMCSGPTETGDPKNKYLSPCDDPMNPGYPGEHYRDFVRKLRINNDTTVASNGGVHFAEFLMREFIENSETEILIFERNFPGNLLKTLIPELKYFTEFQGGKIRILYVNKTENYDEFKESFGKEDDIVIQHTTEAYFEDFGDAGIYVFDSKGTRVEYDTENNKSLYCFNGKKNALYVRNKFANTGIL